MEAVIDRAEPSSDNDVQTVQHVLPDVSVGTSYFSQRYLFAFATQGELLHYIRTQTLKEEVARLEEIHAHWQAQQEAVQLLMHTEAGLAEQCSIEELPIALAQRLKEISEDQLLRKTFASVPFSFALIEADKLIASQRAVNLDYVTRLQKTYVGKTSLADLVEVCLSPRREMPPIQHLEIANNTHVFSSQNLDVRFLGAFFKTLTPEDLQFAEIGGVPAAAIIAFVGYGGAPINVYRVGNRLILNNGFHRVFALRSLGVTKIPALLQHITNWQLEFPPAVGNLPREYLLSAPRPVLIKDFFQDGFSITLRAKQKVKSVMLQTAVNQVDIPS